MSLRADGIAPPQVADLLVETDDEAAVRRASRRARTHEVLDLTRQPPRWVRPETSAEAGARADEALKRLRSRRKQGEFTREAPEPSGLTATDAPTAGDEEMISESRLVGEAKRELHRATKTARPGMLAVVTVMEWEQLRRRLGGLAEAALNKALGAWLAEEADALEQRSHRSDGGLFVLMPEVEAAEGRTRLLHLARRIASSHLEIAGEQIQLTPVIGYALFNGAGSSDELLAQTAMATDDARSHLDLLPVMYARALARSTKPADRLVNLIERVRSPMQVAFTAAVLLCLPFIAYVLVWRAGFDVTSITYPLVSIALAITATVLWVECYRATGDVDLPGIPATGFPPVTAVIAAYLPNEAATIVDTVTSMLAQDYPGEVQVILAYNTPQHLPVEDTLAVIADGDPRLTLLRVEASTSKAQNVNAALSYVTGEFVGIFDADHHPRPGSFGRAWQWLAAGHDIVQGHCVVRNGDASWVARLVAVEFESIYAVSHPGRARLHGFGIFGGSNGYWRTASLRKIRMRGAMLTEDIDSSMRSLLDGFSIVSDPGLLSTELAPVTVRAVWNQRMRWAQGWTQTAVRHLKPALTSDSLTPRQKVGAGFLLGWTQVVPWVTIQVIPILAFSIWRHHGPGNLYFIPLFVLLTLFTLSVGVAQTVFAYNLSDASVKVHKRWFVLYAINSMLWYGEFKNVISRVAQLKEFLGERQWRVTPRSAQTPIDDPAPVHAVLVVEGSPGGAS